MRLWLVLLLAAAPAAAQTRAAGASVSGVSGVAGASASAAPGMTALRHELNLRIAEPPLTAGSAFLADRPAAAWLIQNRPQLYPTMVAAALDLRDLERTLGSFENPRLLREALLVREDSEKANDPARLMKLVDRTPSLAPKREIIAMALLDWSKIGPNSREALARRGIGEAEWASLRLARRFSVMRGVLEQKAGEIMDVPLGHPAYVAKYEQSFRMLAGLMSTEEIIVHNEALERAKRFAAGLRAAEKAAAAGSGAARALEQARKSGDLDEAEGLLDRARGQLKLAPAAAVKPVYDLNPEETHRLTGRLTDAVVRALGATEIGRELIASVREMPVTTELRALAGSSGGHYARLPGSGSVVWNTTLMAELLAEIGRSPRGALNDDEALRDAVVLYSQLMAHELTHHRQRLRKAPLTDKHYSTMYTREDEMEANNAQVAFLRQMRAASPGFAARETRLLATGGRFADFMRQAEEHAADPARMNHWLEGSYTRVPTFERAAIRLMAAGGREQQRMAPAVERIEAELFRRRRLSSAERAALEKDGVEEGRAPLSAIKTSVLRRMRAYWADTGRVMIQEAWRIGRETREQIERLAR